MGAYGQMPNSKPQVISPADKMHELDREIEMRERVYPGWIKDGRITVPTAAKRLGVLKAIREDYRRMVLAGETTLLPDQEPL